MPEIPRPSVRALVWCGSAAVAVLLFFALEGPLQFAAADCVLSGSSPDAQTVCVMRTVRSMLLQKGPAPAMQEFAVLSRELPGLFNSAPGSCHVLAHEVGDAAYEAHLSGTLAEPFPAEQALSTCDYGYYHAYLERLFKDSSDSALASSTCSVLGTGLRDSLAVQAVCFHSAGSGFLRASIPEGWGPSITDAARYARQPLARCASVPGITPRALAACQGGVFGELMYRIITETSSPQFTAQQLFSVCGPYQTERAACYKEIGAALYLVPGFDLPSLSAYASQAQGKDLQQEVFESGLKLFLAPSPLGENPEELLPGCVKAAPDSTWCISGIVDGLFSVREDSGADAVVRGFCASGSVVSRGLDMSCYREAARVFSLAMSPEALARECARLPEKFRYMCARI